MNPELICEYYGGSHSYGLTTPTSDIDYRGVFVFTDIKDIIDPHTHQSSKSNVFITTSEQETQKDRCYYEVRHFLSLLRKGNTGSVEMMFNQTWQTITPLFKLIQSKRNSLLDPAQLHTSVRGYSLSEYNLAIGARPGKIGGKREQSVTKLGFSPKNFVNLFRLLYCAENFYETGNFLVDMRGTFIHPQLMEIKTRPERFTIARLQEMYEQRDKAHEASWAKNGAKISKQYKYDQGIATDLILQSYIRKINKAAKLSIGQKCLSLLGL